MPYYPPRPGGNPRDGEQGGRKLLKRMVLGLSILLIGYGGGRLGIYVYDYFSARQTARELRETVEALEGTAEPTRPAAPAPSAESSRSEEASLSAERPLSAEPALSAASLSAEPVLSAASLSAAPTRPSAPAIAAESSLSGETGADSSPAAGRLPPVEYPGGLDVVPKIRELRKKSEYILGWISMEGVEEPVVRKDNSFFLNHDAMGRRNSNGAIFMDEKTSLLTRPYTILLFGHNMKTGAMFGGLRKYEDFSYFFRHRFFQFDTLYEEGQYVIFAVEQIQITPGTGKYLDLYALTSADRGIRRRALERMKRLSMHEAMVDVNEEDQLVLLITCVGDDEERLVVAARRLREKEAEDGLPPFGSSAGASR